jgi:serine protease Do
MKSNVCNSVSAILMVLLVLLAGAGCSSVRVLTPSAPADQGQTQAMSYQSNVPIDAEWKLPGIVSASQRTQMSIPDIVKRIAKSVVAIHTDTTTYDIFLQPVPAQGVGTGTIIDGKGYILTNSHVVKNARNIKVILYDGKSYDATKVVLDPWTDLAVLQISPPDNLVVAEMGSSRDLQVGEGLVAVGNALALEGGPTVTSGIVSYIGRSIVVSQQEILHDLIQTDAAINPGNSGGPLLNMSGQVVAVNTATAVNAQNIGFAVAITPALPIIEQLIRQGCMSRASLGAELITYGGRVVVISVDQGGPADKSGLKVGDVLASFGGKQVSSAAEVSEIINTASIGQIEEIVFSRRGSEMRASATLIAGVCK